MRLYKTPIIVAVFALIGCLVFYLVSSYRVRGEGGGFAKTVSPAYWLDRAAGNDLFDPAKRIWYKGVRDKKEVCITFDDGPHPLSCKSILATLKEKKVIASFFLVGKQVDGNPDLVKLIAEDGHEIGNHTYDHIRLDKLTREQVYDQINECDIAIEHACGRKAVLFRPPGMRFSDTVLSVVQQKEMIMVHWVIGAKDFIGTVPKDELTLDQQKLPSVTSNMIVEFVTKQLRPGAIILLHDNPVTAVALPKIIDAVRAKGYEFKSCQEMMRELPQKVEFDPNPIVDPTIAMSAKP